MWAQSSIWKVDLPTDPTIWAYLNASAGPSGVVIRARVINDAFEVWQPTDGLQIGVEYITKNCVITTQTNPSQDPPVSIAYRELFTTDDDTCLFDDNLIISDIKWRYKKELGMDDWQVDMELFKRQLNEVMGRDKAAKTIEPEGMTYNPSPQANLWIYEQ
jgi:hypothetical protein